MGKRKRGSSKAYREVLVRQATPKPVYSDVPQPPTIAGAIPKGNKVITFLTPFIDSCVDKIMGEYGPIFAKDGISIVVAADHTPYAEILRVPPEMIVLFRAGTQPNRGKEYPETLRQTIGYCKILKIPTVYYVDDFIFPVNNGLPLQLAANCDRVITATTVLKNWLYESGVIGPIMVVPTHVDLGFFDKQPESTLVDSTRLNVLCGSTGRVGLNAMAGIASYMNDTPERYRNVTLVLVSHGVAYFRQALNRFRNIDKVYFEALPQDQFYSLCRNCKIHLTIGDGEDIAYMVPPEFRGLWLNAKSPIKYCLAGASRSVFIGSPYAPYVESVKHGETGLLVQTAEETVTYIDAVLEKPEFGKKIAEAARKDVEDNWGIEKRYKKFKDSLYGLENWDVPKLRDPKKPIEKIGWILCGPLSIASARIEGVNLNNWLVEKKGVNSSVLYHPPTFRHHLTLDNEEMNKVIRSDYDTVVFQKVFSGDVPPLVQKLNACGIRTVWNISDFVEQGMAMSKLCAKIVTTNEYLKSKFPPDTLDKITIIKDAYESPKELHKESYIPVGEKVRVLWFGSGTHYDEAVFLREIVEGLGMEYYMISTADKNPDKVWDGNEIFSDILRADIVVIPSSLTEFEKCKDENRLVQCMVLGLPTVSSPIPAYTEVIKDGINGFLVEKLMDWVKKLTELKEQSLRETIGNQARLDVVAKYNIDTIGEQWLEVLTK